MRHTLALLLAAAAACCTPTRHEDRSAAREPTDRHVSEAFAISTPNPTFTRTSDGWRAGRVEVARDELTVSTAIGTHGCRFRTTSVAGRQTVSGVEPAHESSALVMHRDGAREELEPHPGGVEQRWVFAARPAAALEVVVAFEGRYLDAHDGDARFECPDGGRARYGAATFVDAHGLRTAVEREIRDGTIVLRVPDSVAASAAYPAVLDPVVGPELDPDVTGTTGTIVGCVPAVAAGPAGWIVAWCGDGGLWFNLLGSDGKLLRPHGTWVDAITGIDGLALSFDGTSFLLSYQKSGGVSGYRIDLAGTRLDATPRTILGPLPQPGIAVATYDGTHHVVIDGYRVARVAPSGVVASVTDLPALTYPEDHWSHIECRSSGQCLAIGTSDRQIVVARVASGTVLDTTPRPIGVPTPGRPAMAPRVTWSGWSWIVVIDKRVTTIGLPEIHATRVGEDGNELGDVVVGSGESPGIGCAGGYCTVVYHAGSEVRRRGIDAGGTLESSSTVLDSTAQHPRIACGTARCLTTMRGAQGRAVRTEGGAVLDVPPLVISTSASWMEGPVVAAAGPTALVVWRDLRDGGSELRATRVSEAGMLDPSSRLVASSPVEAPVVAAIGAQWLLAYRAGSRLAAKWIDATGAPGSEMLIGASSVEHELACTASACLLVWRDETTWKLRARRFPLGGAPGPELAIGGTKSNEPCYELAVAAAPAGFLVLHRNGSGATFASRVDEAGVSGEAAPLGLVTGTDLTAAWADGAWWVVWRVVSSPGTDLLRGVRLAADGTLLPPGAVSLTTSPSFVPRLAAARDGHSALLTWVGAAAGVRGAFLANDGRVLDPGGFALADAPSSRPMTAAVGPGKMLAVYERMTTNVLRVYARFVDGGALDGSPCTEAAACASRLCVDGACCDRGCDGTCEACGTGTCAPVVSADDADSCTGASTCSATSTCAAKNGRPCTSAAECASGACVDGFCCASACGPCGTCAATPGSCSISSAGTPACGPYLCDGASIACPTSCADDGACAADAYCGADAQCHPRKALGAVCDLAIDCAIAGCRACGSGHCVGFAFGKGVCCDSACAGGCGSCTKSGALGTCSPLAAGTTATCSPYVCDGASSSCPTSCAGPSDCAMGHGCDAGACKAHVAIGGSCTRDGECAPGDDAVGRCVDGVCCASACGGVCEACNVPGSVGSCTAVLGSPHPGHGACGDDASQPICERRACDGTSRTACTKRAGAETVCAPHACVDGRETAEARCSDGACPAGVGRDCAPYRCGPDAACATSCTSTSACIDGFTCVDGRCVTAPAADAPTSTDGPSGCGCRVTRSSPVDGLGALAVTSAFAFARRRRRLRL